MSCVFTIRIAKKGEPHQYQAFVKGTQTVIKIDTKSYLSVTDESNLRKSSKMFHMRLLTYHL